MNVKERNKGASVKIRVVIPTEHRRALGLEIGDEVIVDGELRIMTRAEAVKRAQSIVGAKVKNARSLVNELSKERRADAVDE